MRQAFLDCMKPALIAIAFSLLFASLCHAEVYDSEEIANAIYRAEGGSKTEHPYGILSVKCKGKEECRKICLNTIENTFTRWQAEGSSVDFLSYLANRYCPTIGPKLTKSERKLNKFWLKNVKFYLTKGERNGNR